MILVSFRYVHLRCVHRKEGENCLADDQIKKNPIGDALDHNNSCTQKKNLHL